MKIKHEKSKTSRRKEQSSTTRGDRWDLRLYVAGHTTESVTALNNLKMICEEELKGKYQIEVIDLRKKPQIAREAQILAVPTLVRTSPLPVRNIISDLSNRQRILVGLDLIERSAIDRV